MHTHASWYGEQCCRRKFSFLSHQKGIFHFPSIKNGRLLWSNHQTANSKNHHHILQKYYTTLYGQCPTRGIQNLSIHLWRKRQIPAETVGSGSDMNYRYMIWWAWFFTKIIFRFTICYFIKNPMQVERGFVRFKCIQKMRHLNIQSIQKC